MVCSHRPRTDVQSKANRASARIGWAIGCFAKILILIALRAAVGRKKGSGVPPSPTYGDSAHISRQRVSSAPGEGKCRQWTDTSHIHGAFLQDALEWPSGTASAVLVCGLYSVHAASARRAIFRCSHRRGRQSYARKSSARLGETQLCNARVSETRPEALQAPALPVDRHQTTCRAVDGPADDGHTGTQAQCESPGYAHTIAEFSRTVSRRAVSRRLHIAPLRL
ncbi:uncharacterized protein LAESUDRAFT_757482 [Laetiporus sulphureus 93-53]|uniref:Uncharacterized protein n=1 Tax=Laetiporus sulphureus 93-53 TaxID=1314785 RepID=A0A165FCS7_9APHY|nr:uncharacterized protein LAESUDRAFT_757482 [Laetiporus sulphureus 93-53]KZT08773.1 hypothetical protein LAESUDRAFT_757482 [Laetiporus sulphureus 93-53]